MFLDTAAWKPHGFIPGSMMRNISAGYKVWGWSFPNIKKNNIIWIMLYGILPKERAPLRICSGALILSKWKLHYGMM